MATLNIQFDESIDLSVITDIEVIADHLRERKFFYRNKQYETVFVKVIDRNKLMIKTYSNPVVVYLSEAQEIKLIKPLDLGPIPARKFNHMSVQKSIPETRTPSTTKYNVSGKAGYTLEEDLRMFTKHKGETWDELAVELNRSSGPTLYQRFSKQKKLGKTAESIQREIEFRDQNKNGGVIEKKKASGLYGAIGNKNPTYEMQSVGREDRNLVEAPIIYDIETSDNIGFVGSIEIPDKKFIVVDSFGNKKQLDETEFKMHNDRIKASQEYKDKLIANLSANSTIEVEPGIGKIPPVKDNVSYQKIMEKLPADVAFGETRTPVVTKKEFWDENSESKPVFKPVVTSSQVGSEGFKELWNTVEDNNFEHKASVWNTKETQQKITEEGKEHLAAAVDTVNKYFSHVEENNKFIANMLEERKAKIERELIKIDELLKIYKFE